MLHGACGRGGSATVAYQYYTLYAVRFRAVVAALALAAWSLVRLPSAWCGESLGCARPRQLARAREGKVPSARARDLALVSLSLVSVYTYIVRYS